MWRIWFRGRPKAQPSQDGASRVRKDVLRYEIQPNAHVDVFWKVLPIGRGPAVSLFVHGEEVLKFDCFGAGRGHYHVNERQWSRRVRGVVQRLYLPEPTVEAQIERTLFELTANLPVYLRQNDDPRIRAFSIDRERWQEAAQRMKATMLEHMRKVPPASEQQPSIDD